MKPCFSYKLRAGSKNGIEPVSRLNLSYPLDLAVVVMWSISLDATPLPLDADDTLMDFISPWELSSSFNAPQPMRSFSFHTDQNVRPGIRRPSISRACLLSGGETDFISSMCSLRNCLTPGSDKSSITIRILATALHRLPWYNTAQSRETSRCSRLLTFISDSFFLDESPQIPPASAHPEPEFSTIFKVLLD